MPTYEYLCQACEHRFEEFQGMSDPHLVKCPECGKRRLKRLFGTGAGIIFKGSGFYETDYRKKTGGASKEEKAEAARSKGEEAPAARPDPAPDSGADSKADPKPPSKPKPAPKSSSRRGGKGKG